MFVHASIRFLPPLFLVPSCLVPAPDKRACFGACRRIRIAPLLVLILMTGVVVSSGSFTGNSGSSPSLVGPFGSLLSSVAACVLLPTA
jgi:hypothetical protein